MYAEVNHSLYPFIFSLLLQILNPNLETIDPNTELDEL
jgi:hypothetical protein